MLIYILCKWLKKQQKYPKKKTIFKIFCEKKTPLTKILYYCCCSTKIPKKKHNAHIKNPFHYE